MNNPLQLIQALTNPQQFIENMMNNNQIMSNPMMKNGMDMFKSGNRQGLENLVNNIAQQKGTSIDEVRKKLGI